MIKSNCNDSTKWFQVTIEPLTNGFVCFMITSIEKGFDEEEYSLPLKRESNYGKSKLRTEVALCRLEMLKDCLKEGVKKVASEPEGWRQVGSHELSPLTDRTLMEVTEAAAVRQLWTKVVPRIERPLQTKSLQRALFCSEEGNKVAAKQTFGFTRAFTK